MGPFRLVMVQPLYSMPCNNPVRVDPSLMSRCVIGKERMQFWRSRSCEPRRVGCGQRQKETTHACMMDRVQHQMNAPNLLTWCYLACNQ